MKEKITTALAVRILMDHGILCENVDTDRQLRKYGVYEEHETFSSKRIAPSQFRELLEAGLLELVETVSPRYGCFERNFYRLKYSARILEQEEPEKNV